MLRNMLMVPWVRFCIYYTMGLAGRLQMKNIKLEKFEPTNQQSVSLVKGYLYDYPLPDSISTDWYKFEIIQHTYYTNKITQTSFDYDLSIEIIRGIIDFFSILYLYH